MSDDRIPISFFGQLFFFNFIYECIINFFDLTSPFFIPKEYLYFKLHHFVFSFSAKKDNVSWLPAIPETNYVLILLANYGNDCFWSNLFGENTKYVYSQYIASDYYHKSITML